MRAYYDSEANALAVNLVAEPRAAWTDEVDDRCFVDVTERGEPVSVEVLYPPMGLDEPIRAAAARHGLDAEALVGAARAAVAAPDREVVIEVKAGSLA